MPSSLPPDPNQLNLAIDDAPEIVRRHGLREIHRYPYVSMGYPLWHVKRVPTRIAWECWPEIELHSPAARVALVLDCDSDPRHYLQVAFGFPTIRPPNWIVSRGPTGHAHVVYTLAHPVLRGEKARRKPVALLGRIAEFYIAAYEADTGYVGLLTHNPTHPRYKDTTTWWHEEPWSLGELAEDIPPRWRMPKRPVTVEGRNCTLFRAAIRHFGQPANWDASTDLGDVLAWIEAAFIEWYVPDDVDGWHRNECLWIAKSVVGYCRRNLASEQTQRNFAFIQADRGRRSGQVRRRGTPLEQDRTPWETQGISRPTWYRDQGRTTPKARHGGARR